MNEIEFRYAEKYWTLGNGITAFAVVQDLGFAISFPNSVFYCTILQDRWTVILFSFIVASLFLYVLGIVMCARRERKLLGTAHTDKVRRSITFAIVLRCTAVVLATGLLLSLSYDAWRGPVLGGDALLSPGFCGAFNRTRSTP